MYTSPEKIGLTNDGVWNIVGNRRSIFWFCLKLVIVDETHCIYNGEQTHNDSAVSFLAEYENNLSLRGFLMEDILGSAV